MRTVLIKAAVVLTVAPAALGACGTPKAGPSLAAPATTSTSGPSTSGPSPSTGVPRPSVPVDPGEQAHVAPLDLSAYGFKLDDDREWRGERGNRVTLRRYVGPRVARPTPDPSGLARDAVYINTARVTGLGARARDSLDALVVPDGTNQKREEVRVHGLPALLFSGEGGRQVAFAVGDWRVQVSVDAPLDVLSNDDLIAIAEQVVLQ
jgi:hypothetical protein